MSQLCERNPDVINILTKLVDAVQLCLEEKERLNDAEKTSVLRNMMLSVCFTLDFEKIIRRNGNCVQDPRRMPADDKCVKKFPNFVNIYDLEPIPLEHADKECHEFLEVWNCKINTANDCDVSAKNLIREFISVIKEFILC
ncbi:uncharacterized protein LOC117181305 [Belonocnema kinseyi]|uniref:uncharacterized protein LOC117181305 n=1 Tax=Belonocnema kinseyi TaxID=2817044 RepID=UPI00143D2BBB|nr:uncharacterized protein LOC117181305 [Belonocnema kinseyi]